ncbi:TetR/AcrR family transcriptional regulator [Neobacillus sp. 19]|uniref:TetR/AcrR family transcriptional regulator n=1 Tax=Neobacillus sp. 19 TaxID=3394458 RepID=UPI003BF6F86A
MVVDMTDTSDRLLFSAINLIAEKGYKAVSTKEIAKEASVSEMTLFRHFGTKQGILEAAIDRFYYSTSMKELFDKNIVWDLEKDLLMISEAYHKLMKKNQKVILIAYKGRKYN